MFDFSFRFDSWFEALPASPRDVGVVSRCVLRKGPGVRETPDAIELVPGRGVLGDGWSDRSHPRPGNEVSMINVHVIRSFADDDRTPLCGDNLHVDLDLSEANLPVGTLLEIGSALVRISDQPHRPCKHFVERFGAAAAKKVARANRMGRRGRGVLCTIERAGTVRVGDAIRVQRAK